MTSKIINLIADYTASTPTATANGETSETSKRAELHDLLAPYFSHTVLDRAPSLRWEAVPVRLIIDDRAGLSVGHSHTRSVYISSEIPGCPRWVVKLDDHSVRSQKMFATFLHADEVAYKISAKLLLWNTVPKTKILHQSVLSDPQLAAKYQKYTTLMQCFVKQNAEKPSLTFTFQSFVRGKHLPNLLDIERGTASKPDVLLPSYQRAFLLDMILGKFDARGDNIFYDPETRELFEIDNEYLAGSSYCSRGILHAFPDLKREVIGKDILEAILRVTPQQVDRYKAKYMQRDIDLQACHAREPFSTVIPDIKRIAQENWDTIAMHLHCVQKTIQTLFATGIPVTILEVEKGVENLQREEARRAQEKSAAKKREEEIRKKREEEERLAKEREQRRLDPPKPSHNMLADIHDWIKIGHCVVLHSNYNNGHIYYQGKETDVENLRVIDIDIAASTHLLDRYEWPEALRLEGISLADPIIQKQFAPQKEPKRVRELFGFRFGY